MSKIEDGGAAFPITPIFSESHGWLRPCEIMHSAEGMTLRDYFAAAAFQGLLINGHHKNVRYSYIAQDAYKLADAMIEARKGDA